MKIRNYLSAIMIICFMAIFSIANAQQPVQRQAPVQEVEIEIEDDELEDFAEAIAELTTLQQEAQKDMVKVVTDEGLDLNMYNKIHQMKMQGLEPEDLDEDVLEKYEDANEKLMEMQEELNEEMSEVIEESGIEPQRFQQISMAIQSDPELQERYRLIMTK